MILLIFGLAAGIPNVMAGSDAIFKNSDLNNYYSIANSLFLDDAWTDDKYSPKTTRDKMHESPYIFNAVLDIVCPEDLVAKCNSPEAAIPRNVAEFIALGGMISSTCGIISVSIKVIETSLGGCPEVLQRTVHAVDRCGGQASCSYTVTILDDLQPPMMQCPADITVDCASDVPDADASTVGVTDMCGTVTVKHLGDDTTSLGLCPGIVYRRYIAEDQCGNTATCIQTITVNNKCDPDDPCFGICDDEVPVFTVDLSGMADSTWISPETLIEGSCCDQPGSQTDMCAHFSLTLAEDAVAVMLEIISGPGSPNGMSFQIGCNDSFPVNEIICLSGEQNLELTFCQPDSQQYIFAITSYSIASLPDEDQDGRPDVCIIPCEEMKLGIDDCAIVYIGYAPAECTDISVEIAGGVPPFSYLWSTNDTTEMITVCPLFHHLYSVTVTDALGCTIEGSVPVLAVDVRCNLNRSVQVCHLDPLTQQSTTECIDDSLVAVHLGHGDLLGPCGSNPCHSFNIPILEKDMNLTSTGGSESDSPIARVRHKENHGDEIFPNPAIDEVTIRFEIPKNQSVVFDIFDAQGRHIDSATSHAVKGINTYKFNTSFLGAGLYLVRYRVDQEIRLLKFVKID